MFVASGGSRPATNGRAGAEPTSIVAEVVVIADSVRGAMWDGGERVRYELLIGSYLCVYWIVSTDTRGIAGVHRRIFAAHPTIPELAAHLRARARDDDRAVLSWPK